MKRTIFIVLMAATLGLIIAVGNVHVFAGEKEDGGK